MSATYPAQEITYKYSEDEAQQLREYGEILNGQRLTLSLFLAHVWCVLPNSFVYVCACTEEEMFGNDMQFLDNGASLASIAHERKSLLQEKRSAYEQEQAEVGARPRACVRVCGLRSCISTPTAPTQAPRLPTRARALVQTPRDADPAAED